MSDRKRVVVLGGSGFLGSHVADALSDAGREVVIADRRPSPWLRSDQDYVEVDVLDEGSLLPLFDGMTAVYNFAGISDIDECRSNPVRTAHVNVYGHALVIDAVHQAGVGRYLYASSVYVYSEAGSFYRASKQACELQIEAYAKVHGLAHTILRYGSLYGPRSDSRNGIHRLLDDAVRGGPVRYSGTGEEMREFIHVHDAARLSVDALDDRFVGDHLVLTGDRSIQMRTFLEMLAEIFKVGIEYEEPGDREHYTVTPYTYRPPVGRRLTSTVTIDLGQGLIDAAAEIDVARRS